jgi:hypothetical protein
MDKVEFWMWAVLFIVVVMVIAAILYTLLPVAYVLLILSAMHTVLR